MKNVLSPSREGEGNNWEKSSDGKKKNKQRDWQGLSKKEKCLALDIESHNFTL